MVDGITVRSDGRAEMAYTGAPPWHERGNELKPGASVDEWIDAAGFDWQIMRTPVCYNAAGKPEYLEVLDRHVFYRSDTEAFLSIVSDKYQIVQPSDVLRYFEKLTADAGFTLETAGTLFGGIQFWALASIGAEASVLSPKDKMKGRLLLSTSCDGSLSTRGKFVCERVVCHNTLTYAHNEQGKEVRIHHRKEFKPDEMHEKLGISLRGQFTEQMKVFRKLAETPMEPIDMLKATITLYEPEAHTFNEDALIKLVRKKSLVRVNELSLNAEAIGANLKGCKNTSWGWLNSVTQFVDHDNLSVSPDRRLQRAWFGSGEACKQRALLIAEAHAEGLETYRHDFALSDDNLLSVNESVMATARQKVN